MKHRHESAGGVLGELCWQEGMQTSVVGGLTRWSLAWQSMISGVFTVTGVTVARIFMVDVLMKVVMNGLVLGQHE